MCSPAEKRCTTPKRRIRAISPAWSVGKAWPRRPCSAAAELLAFMRAAYRENLAAFHEMDPQRPELGAVLDHLCLHSADPEAIAGFLQTAYAMTRKPIPGAWLCTGNDR